MSRVIDPVSTASLSPRSLDRQVRISPFTADDSLTTTHEDETAHFVTVGAFGIEAPFVYIGETARFRMSGGTVVLEKYSGSWSVVGSW